MQQQTIEDFDQLIACLDARCVEREYCFIVIEGFTGSGKSKLAERLACRLGSVHVALDEFLNKHPVPELADMIVGTSPISGLHIYRRNCARL